MRFLNSGITAVILTALVSLTGCSGSNGSTNSDNPQVPPNTSTYGVFRPLKASVQGKENMAATSSNQSITMSTPREGHKAVAIGNGKFLLFGGETDYTPGKTSTFDLFDSETERFTLLPTVTGGHRVYDGVNNSYAMLRLPNGRILISGGVAGSWTDTLEIFDPETQAIVESKYGTWPTYNQVAAMFNIGNNKVLMFGLALTDTSMHNVGNGVLDLTTMEFNFIDTPENVFGASAVQLEDGSIIYAGGTLENNVSIKSIYKIDPVSLITTKIGDLQTARSLFGMTILQDGNIGVYGGISRTGTGIDNLTRLSSVEVISMLSDSFGSTSFKTPLLAPRSHTGSTLLQNGYVLNAGGVNEEGLVASSEFVHNHITNTSGTTGSLLTPRRLYSSIPLNNGRVLISGGYGKTADAYTTAEIYDPAQKIIIKFDTTTEVTKGTVVHFSSESSDVIWSCTDKGSIDSNSVLTTLKIGNITVTGKNSTGEASVTIKVIMPVEE